MVAVDSQGQVFAGCPFADALQGQFGTALRQFGKALRLSQSTDFRTIEPDAAALMNEADSCGWKLRFHASVHDDVCTRFLLSQLLMCDVAQHAGHFDANALSAGQPTECLPDSTA